MYLFYVAFFPGAIIWGGISKKKMFIWREKPRAQTYIFVSNRKADADTIIQPKQAVTTFGMTVIKTEGPIQSHFIYTGENHKSWHRSPWCGQLGKTPRPHNS